MKLSKQAAMLILTFGLLVTAEHSFAQAEGSWVDGGGGLSGGSNPLGNVTLVQSGGGTTTAGTYVALVNNSDGSYTLHFITVDNAGIVTNHTTSTDSGDGNPVTGREFTNGESMGDVLEGIEGDSAFGGFGDPMGCLGLHCNESDPFGLPSFGLQYSNNFGGG